MEISDRGLAFVTEHEGFVSKAYRDPVGVVTIGVGFTNGSKIAVQMLGKIKMGMTITRDQADRVLRETMRQEYGPPVTKAMGSNIRQHQWDAGASYCFNCGPGAMNDNWVKAFQMGNVIDAATKLARSRITAKGVRLRGLENRRKAESRLLLDGHYGARIGMGQDPARSVEVPKARIADQDLKVWQEKLEDLGYYDGEIDGWHGPKTTAAVKAFQKAHPHLIDDGILGPATMATIERALAARKTSGSAAVVVGGGAVASGAVAYSGASLAMWGGIGLGALVLIAAGIMVWRYRDEIKQQFLKET